MGDKIPVDEGLQILAEQVGQLSHVVAGIIGEMKTITDLVFADMKATGKLESEYCEDCDLITFIPNIEGIEVNPCCNQCLKEFGDALPTLDDFSEEE